MRIPMPLKLRAWCALALLASPALLRAQQNIGLATGNYAGISGAWLNPASIVDSRFKFDMTLVGYESYFTNNYLLLSNRALRDRLFSKAPYNSSREQAMADLLTPLDDKPDKVKGAIVSELQFPFSFMASTGERSAIGLNIRNRTGIEMENLDVATAQMIYDDLGNSALYGVPMDNSGYRFNFMNWMEVGFTYGRVLVKSDHHMLKAAGTIKLMAGSASIHYQSEDLVVTFDGKDTLSMQSPLIEYGRTEQADFDTYRRRNLLNGVEDWALGWDLGLVYELRGNVAKGRFTDLDNTVKERLDVNKYLLRVGLSLVDAGRFTFTRRELAQDHSANITGWDISQVNATDLDSWDTAYAQQVDYVANGSPTYTHRLPTAVAANIDLHLFGGFYLNAGTYRDATRWFPEADATLHAREWTAVTPRFENRWFGLYLPVSMSDDQYRIGATMRIGPVYFGSNNIADQLNNDQNTQADYHFGVRFSIPHGKPTALRKRYEAFRMQQQAISSNRTRIDSLERELYALKMVVLHDSLRGPAVVNNYYAAPGSDTVQVRLQRENDLLKRSLAEAYVQAEQDSAALALSEKGKSGAAAKGDRAAAKAAADQAAATEDMAKQMEKINKRLGTQNAILTAGAVTGVVAASRSKGDKPVTGTAIYVNDSTVVLNGDTLRMVVPVGAAVPRAVGIPDTARAVVRDTVRIVETRVDTVRIIERDTAVVERTVQAPGTIAREEAERQRLTEPIHFASGRTALGPQGRMKVAELAAWLRAHPQVNVVVTGVADASGSVSVNEGVADKRAQSVRQELVANGVEAARIATERRLAPAGATPDPKDRRAEVRLIDGQH